MLNSGHFHNESKVEKVGEGVYEVDTSKDWFGAVGLFGGYVNMVILQALMAEVDDPPRLPRSLAAHFLRPYPAERMRIETCLERAGSSVSVLSFRTFVGDDLCGVGVGTFGKHRKADEKVHKKPPPAKPFDPTAEQIKNTHSLECLKNFEIWIEDENTAKDKSELIAWARPTGGGDIDSLFYLAVSDAIPPVVVKQDNYGRHFMGTMDFIAHFRQPEVIIHNEPVLGRIYTAASKEGYVDEDCEIFSPTGELLLQSRQMRFMQKV